MPDQAAFNEYLSARRAAKKYLTENARKNGQTGHLPVLEQILETVETVGEINLGIHEIPLKKIVGTYTDARSSAFAGNFMPLLGEGTEFASKWQSLYVHHIKEGISDPIKVYEFLNLFYVIEGNKRVSLLKHVGAYSMTADVIRIIPKRDEDNPEIALYYEFLDYNPKSLAFSDMWFSKKGSFTRLIQRAKQCADRIPELVGKAPEEWLPQIYKDFSRQYRAAGFDKLEITTGDALLEFLRVYGFPYGLDFEELGVKVKNCEAQFRLAAGQGSQKLIEDADVAQTPWLLAKIAPRKARAVFVYRSPLGESPRTRAHEFGRLGAEKYFDGRVKTEAVYGVTREQSHIRLKEIADTNPDIIFTVNSNLGHASLQTSVEIPETIVFNLNHTQPGARLNTYYCKLHELTFVMGILAGSTTRSDVIGFINPLEKGLGLTYSVNAFALGARLVNHNVRVKVGALNSAYSEIETKILFKMLAESGCDIICSQYPDQDPFWMNKSDNLYGMLCSVRPNGSIQEYLATSTWNWEVVYTKIIGDYLDGSFDILKKADAGSLHFWLGLSAGATDILMSHTALGPHTARLGRIFTQLLAHSAIHPLVGPIRDRDGAIRVGKGDVPSLQDIQTMRWLCDIVDEVITLN